VKIKWLLPSKSECRLPGEQAVSIVDEEEDDDDDDVDDCDGVLMEGGSESKGGRQRREKCAFHTISATHDTTRPPVRPPINHSPPLLALRQEPSSATVGPLAIMKHFLPVNNNSVLLTRPTRPLLSP
jgi:hypothetical protein